MKKFGVVFFLLFLISNSIAFADSNYFDSTMACSKFFFGIDAFSSEMR